MPINAGKLGDRGGLPKVALDALFCSAHCFVFRPYGARRQRVSVVRAKHGEAAARSGGTKADATRPVESGPRASMTAQQRIVRVRRNYNQWVANQTLEDYALRFTPRARRKWSSVRVANTAFGAVSFLALEAIGGSIAINYGFVNATAGDPGRRRAHLPDRPADHLLRVALRRRHGPAHARRRLRLHRLDYHLADLRLVHVHLLRDRSRDHGARAGDVLRHAAVRRLHHQLAGGHPAGDARHHAHQPPSGVDAAALAGAAPAAVRLHRIVRSALVRGMDAVSRHRRNRRGRHSTSSCSAPPRPSSSR